MVADAYQDNRDNVRLSNLIDNLKDKKDHREEPKFEIFQEYLKVVDIYLVKRGMAFKPAKSIEFGKTDQSMLNHIRNGILFLLRFNDALEQLDVRSLDEKGLRECIALFVVHELHKLESGEWMEDEEAIERPDSMMNEFDIPEAMVKRFVEVMHLRDFAPELGNDDYFSVAVALHKSRFSRSGARTSHFMDLEPFLYLMDNMASCASPEEAVSARSLTALRDGFPQDLAESQLNLQYHRLDDVKGILSGIINKSVADVLQKQGLIMLMAYQDGCVYLGKGPKREAISNDLVEEIYTTLVDNIRMSTQALSDAHSLGRKVNFISNLGFYKLSDEYYFFSGPKNMLCAFLDKSLTEAHIEKHSRLSDEMLESFSKVQDAVHIDLEKSATGQRILLEFARGISTIHKSFVAELIPDNFKALQKTCEIWNVPEDLRNCLSNIPESTVKGLTSGGKWEYSLAIAQCVMDQVIDGVKLRNLQSSKATEALFRQIWGGITQIEGWDDFISEKTSLFRRELVEYLHDVLSVNGTISALESKLSDTYKEYEKGGKTCNLCNRGTLLKKEAMKNSNAFLSFNFTNRVFVGSSKPTNVLTCIPCGVELALRRNGFDNLKGSSEEKLYFHFIPDYFFTPESWDLANAILSRFSDGNTVRMAALAKKIFQSKYADKFPEVEGDLDIYDTWITDLAVESNAEGPKGLHMIQYMAQGYQNLIGNASMIFDKPSKNTTEFHFFGVYIALALAAYTGMRVVVSQSPITTMRGRDFKEMVALDSINSHVTEFYGKYIALSKLEETLKLGSALIRLGYKASPKKKDKRFPRDSLFPKYLRMMRGEILPGSSILKIIYRNSDDEYKESNVQNLLDEAIFLDGLRR
jgi:CRISPR-associated protein Csc3